MRLLLKFLWLIPFLCFISGYIGARLLLHRSTFAMPLLIGKTADAALIMLSAKNLNPRIIGTTEDPDIEPGTILNQIPRTGSQVRPHQTVFLVIASRPSVSVMAQWIGVLRDSIEGAYASCSIKPTFVKLPYPLPQDTCFAQYPSAGSSTLDSPIIYIAQEPEKKYIIPSLIGAPAQTAIEHLHKQQVKVTIIGEYSDTDKKELTQLRIIDQRPLPGSFITVDSMHKASLHIRLGP